MWFVRMSIYLILLGFGSHTLAQSASCPDLVAEAIALTETNCSNMERNQVCYGNLQVEAQFQEGMEDLSFEQAGDTVALDAIQSLNLSERLTEDAWGVALMSVQGNLPDTVPGQNVTMLLFGNVTLENAGRKASLFLELTLNGYANIRSGPGTNYEIITNLAPNTQIRGIGRNEVGDWLQVELPDTDGTGWIHGSLIAIAGDAMQLLVADPVISDEIITGGTALQAFYFRSNIIETDCIETPQEGVLIQTPSGVGEVSILINEVQITLGSTILIQAVPGETMTVTLQQGTANIESMGIKVDLPEGKTARIPLDAEGLANGIPIIDGIPVTWAFGASQVEGTCTDGSAFPHNAEYQIELLMEDNAVFRDGVKMTLIPGNTYDLPFDVHIDHTPPFNDAGIETYTVVSPVQFDVVATMTRRYDNGGTCEGVQRFPFTYVEQASP